MASGWLWALDDRGATWRLPSRSEENVGTSDWSSDSSHWLKVPHDVAFCRLSAGPWSTWAVGTDGRAYVRVSYSEVPIRHTEEVFQNQRWYPLIGFTSTVLPTDRSSWSDSNGEPTVQKNAILLPSDGWSWEDPWVPDTDPTVADKEGWQYATNFPRQFYPEKFKRAFVRRKRWVRSRRYTGLEKWVRLRHVMTYAFLDIAVGGTELPGAGQRHVSVWVVGATGRLLFREGVCASQPEGVRWNEINGPDHDTEVGEELRQVSCSPGSGQLWVVTWDGRLYARTGIQGSDPIGSSWVEIARPKGLRILNVAIGENVAWVITMDGKAWSLLASRTEAFLKEIKETSWVEMVQSMSFLSMGPNDQIVGISLEAEEMMVRTEVTPKEQIGRTWRSILAPKKIVEEEASDWVVENPENQGTVQRPTSLLGSSVACAADAIAHLLTPSHKPSKGFAVRFVPKEVEIEVYNKEQELFGRLKDDVTIPNHQIHSTPASHIPSNGTTAAGHNQDSTDTSGFESDTDASSIVDPADGGEQALLDLPVDDLKEERTASEDIAFRRDRWFLVSLGGCSFTADTIPEGWTQTSGALQQKLKLLALASRDAKSGWRHDIITQLTSKNKCLRLAYWDFVVSATGTDAQWVKSGRCQIWSMSGALSLLRGRWVDATLELVLEEPTAVDPRKMGSIKVTYSKGPQKIEILLNQVTCVLPYFDADAFHFTLKIFTPSLIGIQKPLQLAMPSQEEQCAWLTELYRPLCKVFWPPVRDLNGCVWAVTKDGQVISAKPVVQNGSSLVHQFWRPIPGSMCAIDAGAEGVVWGLSREGQPWCLSSVFHLGNSYTDMGPESGIQTDTVVERIFENQRYSPILGYITFPGLMSGRFHAWSDETGLCKRTKETAKLPGAEWEWLGEWELDFDEPCDPEGWRYAKSFRNQFYPEPKLRRSTVRRRIWIRKRRVRIEAPWLPVDSPKLSVLSVQKDLNISEKKAMDFYVWVLTENGDVLCRSGVIPHENPKGKVWQHVLSPCPMLSISAGCNYRVWAIGNNGKAYVRYCANPEDIMNCGWHEVNPPEGCSTLKAISAGERSVWARARSGDLYLRRGISQSVPEGLDWLYVYSDISGLCVSPDDRLWVTMSYSNPSVGTISGTMTRRVGISETCLEGTSWDYGIAGPIVSVSAGAWREFPLQNQ